MALTPNFDLWSPDDGDDWDLTVDMAAMQNSVDAALSSIEQVPESWSGSPVIGSGQIVATRVGRIVEVVWSVTSATFGTSGHTQIGQLPDRFSPARLTTDPAERRAGSAWFTGTQYGTGAVYPDGRLFVANPTREVRDATTGGFVFFAEEE